MPVHQELCDTLVSYLGNRSLRWSLHIDIWVSLSQHTDNRVHILVMRCGHLFQKGNFTRDWHWMFWSKKFMSLMWPLNQKWPFRCFKNGIFVLRCICWDEYSIICAPFFWGRESEVWEGSGAWNLQSVVIIRPLQMFSSYQGLNCAIGQQTFWFIQGLVSRRMPLE